MTSPWSAVQGVRCPGEEVGWGLGKVERKEEEGMGWWWCSCGGGVLSVTTPCTFAGFCWFGTQSQIHNRRFCLRWHLGEFASRILCHRHEKSGRRNNNTLCLAWQVRLKDRDA